VEFAKGKDVWAHPVICDGRLYFQRYDAASRVRRWK
jgi:hypothetical protein